MIAVSLDTVLHFDVEQMLQSDAVQRRPIVTPWSFLRKQMHQENASRTTLYLIVLKVHLRQGQ